jgi:RNA polymerase sigma-70 factor, ECF subfamily
MGIIRFEQIAQSPNLLAFPEETSIRMTDPEFCAVYGQNKNMLYRFAWRMTGSPMSAEDIVQDCFLVLLRNPDAYDPQRGTLRSYLIGVTRNLALKRLRLERSFEGLDSENVAHLPIDLSSASSQTQRANLIAAAIAALPPLQRETLILAEYEELTLDEISVGVGAELAAVKSRLHRARENLRRMLAPLLEKKPETKGTYGTTR